MPSADALFLDVGWTMTYPRESMWDVFAQICTEAGSAVTSETVEAFVHDFLLSRRRQAIEELERGTEYPDSDAEFLSIFLSMSRLVFTFAGLDGDRHEALAGKFLDRFWDRANWHVFPDVVPALERLRACGVCLGIISNASSELEDFLKKIGLYPFFDFVCISAVEGVRKPGRRIYEKALKRAGVDPWRAVHVGDMLLEDVLGPSKLGIRPFLIDRRPMSMFPRHPERPDPWIQTRVEIVRTLDEVTSALGV